MLLAALWWYGPPLEISIGDVTYHDRLSPNVISRSQPPFRGNYGAGLVSRELVNVEPSVRPQQQEFFLQNEAKFSPYLILINNTTDPFPVLVSAILDYTQVSFSLDGKFDLLHYVTIPPKTELNIPIEISIESPGMHDLFIISFYYPDEHPRFLNHRDNLLWASVGGRRALIYKGNSDVPAREMPTPYRGIKYTEHLRTEEVQFLRINGAQNQNPANRKLVIARTAGGENFNIESTEKTSGQN